MDLRIYYASLDYEKPLFGMLCILHICWEGPDPNFIKNAIHLFNSFTFNKIPSTPHNQSRWTTPFG